MPETSGIVHRGFRLVPLAGTLTVVLVALVNKLTRREAWSDLHGHVREKGVTMASKKPMTPGTKAPSSGQGVIIGPRGGNTGKEVTIVKGHKIPPTPKPGQKIVMVDPTKNGAGKGK